VILKDKTCEMIWLVDKVMMSDEEGSGKSSGRHLTKTVFTVECHEVVYVHGKDSFGSWK